jgi:multidrug efflux pump subunit AcrA (membrane-fusion protein)
MSVTATIITNIASDVIIVPTSTVQSLSGQSYVKILKDGKVTNVDVETGNTSDTQTEIVSGVTQGDVVIFGTVTPNSTGSTSSPFSSGGFGGIRAAGGGNATFRRPD